jgi:hypothetical protein
MGLDIYFSKVNRVDYSTNKEKAVEKEISIGYFRKVNCLLPFFGYEGNCEYLEIEKCQIEDLIETAKELLDNYETFKQDLLKLNCDYEKANETSNEEDKKQIEEKLDLLWKAFEELADKKLPTCDGFYFGDTEYRDWYIEDLLEIVEDFTKILEETDFDTEQVLMYCWW